MQDTVGQARASCMQFSHWGWQRMRSQMWEKDLFCAEAKFSSLITHKFKAVIATGLKPGIAILQSLQYTRCKFCTPDCDCPTQLKIGHFMPDVGAPPFQVRRQLHFLTVDFYPINQDWSLRLSVSSSYDRLKTAKFWHFARSGPSSQICLQMSPSVSEVKEVYGTTLLAAGLAN